MVFPKAVVLMSNRSSSTIYLLLNDNSFYFRVLQFNRYVKQYYSKHNGSSDSIDKPKPSGISIYKSNPPENGKSTDKPEIPEEPTTCCMSGCANCVWLEYAEKLSKIFADSGEKSRDIILSKVTDENMKAFLKMELNALMNKKVNSNTDDNTNK